MKEDIPYLHPDCIIQTPHVCTGEVLWPSLSLPILLLRGVTVNKDIDACLSFYFHILIVAWYVQSLELSTSKKDKSNDALNHVKRSNTLHKNGLPVYSFRLRIYLCNYVSMYLEGKISTISVTALLGKSEWVVSSPRSHGSAFVPLGWSVEVVDSEYFSVQWEHL